MTEPPGLDTQDDTLYHLIMSSTAPLPAGAGPAEHAHGHRHGPPRDRAGAPRLSMLRASLGTRLLMAGALSALMWSLVLWVVS